jgi:hypothetical protein
MLAAAGFLLVSGCGHAPPTVEYASDSLYLGNPIKRIAVFSSANVFWPRTGGKQAVIDVAASRQCQERLLPLLQRQLAQKGYEVAIAAPVGVAFVDPGIDYSSFQYVGPDGSDVLWPAMIPVFEYPILTANPNLERAVRDIIEPMNVATKQGQLPRFQPNPAAVKFIGRTLDPSADTLCYLRGIGDKYSAGRKFGAMMFSLRAGGGGLSDDLFASLTCMQVDSGRVLWKDYVLDNNADPVEPTQIHVATMIQYLPPRGYSMNPEVVRAYGGPVPKASRAPGPPAGPGPAQAPASSSALLPPPGSAPTSGP